MPPRVMRRIMREGLASRMPRRMVDRVPIKPTEREEMREEIINLRLFTPSSSTTRSSLLKRATRRP